MNRKGILVGVFVASNLFVLTSLGIWLALGRRQMHERAAETIENLVTVLGHAIEANLGQIDQTLQWTKETLEARNGGLGDARVEQFIRQRVRESNDVDGILWLDAAGSRVHSIGIGPAEAASPEDQAYFRRVLAEPAEDLVLSWPHLAQVQGRWTLGMGKRLHKPDGGLLGAVVAQINLDRFTRTLASINVGPHGAVALRGSDLDAIAFFTPQPGPVFLRKPGWPSPDMRRCVAAGLAQATYFTKDNSQGIPRMTSYLKVPGRPLYVAAGIASQDYLAPWRRQFLMAALVGASFLTLSLLSSWLLLRAWEADRRAQAERFLQEERMRAQAERREQERRLGEILDAVDASIFTKDAQLRYTYINRRGCEYLGMPADKVLGMTDGALFPEAGLEASEAGERQLLGGEVPFVREEREWSGSGAPKTFQVVKVPLRDGAGRIQGLAGNATDITLRKQEEAERAQIRARLQQVQKLDSLGVLAGGIAHDMNNILAVIQAVAETLMVTQPDAAHQGPLDTIGKATSRGRDLLKGLTSFLHKGIQAPETVDLNEVARKEMEILRRTTKQKIDLVLDLDEGLPPIRGEKSALAAALMNLCVNALDALEGLPGSGRLTLRTRGLPGGQVGLEVEDNGPGMAPEVQARALEPFFTTKPVGKGTGLGLSVVYATMKAHGGDLSLQSAPGLGTVALLRFPVCQDAPSPEVGPPPPAAGTEPLAILLVDDNDLIRESMPDMLALSGHRVATASGGEEALALLRAGEHPDLVILDLNMPGMNGLEVLAGMRAAGFLMPVLLASGHLDSDTQRALSREPSVLSIQKPFTLAELEAKLLSLHLDRQADPD